VIILAAFKEGVSQLRFCVNCKNTTTRNAVV
jgi:hypothetical protein